MKKPAYKPNIEWRLPRMTKCVVCGNKFPVKNFAKTCTRECSRELRRIQRRKYYRANSAKILAQQRQRQRPIIRPCATCRKEFDNRKGAKTCGKPECLKEYRRLHAQKYYLATREKQLARDREKRAKWVPKPRQCVDCGEDFVVTNRKNGRANACPKCRHARKLRMERARYHARRDSRSQAQTRSISP